MTMSRGEQHLYPVWTKGEEKELKIKEPESWTYAAKKIPKWSSGK